MAVLSHVIQGFFFFLLSALDFPCSFARTVSFKVPSLSSGGRGPLFHPRLEYLKKAQRQQRAERQELQKKKNERKKFFQYARCLGEAFAAHPLNHNERDGKATQTEVDFSDSPPQDTVSFFFITKTNQRVNKRKKICRLNKICPVSTLFFNL